MGFLAPTTLADADYYPQGITVDEHFAYWVNTGDNTVMKVPLGGGAVVTIASGQQGLANIAVDASYVYWGTYTTPVPGAAATGSVMKAPLNGGAPTILATFVGATFGLALDDKSIYFTTASDGSSTSNAKTGPPSGKIMKAPLGGGAVVTLASGQDDPWCVAVDSTSVYWANFAYAGSGMVVKAPVNGGAATTLASGQDHPSSIAVDERHVYWTNHAYDASAGTVMRVPLAGGSVETVARGQTAPTSVVLDATNVYWTTDTIMTVSKP